MARSGPFRIAAYVRVACDPDGSRARSALADELASYLRLPDYRAHLERQGFDPSAVDPESVGIAGDPDRWGSGSGIVTLPIDELVVRPVPVGEAGVAAAVAATAPLLRRSSFGQASQVRTAPVCWRQGHDARLRLRRRR